MNISLSNFEVFDMLRNGSSNQQAFIKRIPSSDWDDVFDTLENIWEELEFQEVDDIRGALNGGALYVSDKDDLSEDMEDFVICELSNYKVVVFDYSLY